MTSWTSEELNNVGLAEELRIAGRKSDDTLRKFTIIWVVRVGDDLYVRSVNGRDSDWFKGIQVRHEGQIHAGGVEKSVQFVEIDVQDKVNNQINSAYADKYHRYAQSIIDRINSPEARSATLKLIPR